MKYIKLTFLFLFFSMAFVANGQEDSDYSNDLPDLIPLANEGITIINNTGCELQLVLKLGTSNPPFVLKEYAVPIAANGTIIYSNSDVKTNWWPVGAPLGTYGFVPVSWKLKDAAGNLIGGYGPGVVNPLGPTTFCLSNPGELEPCDCFCITTNMLHDHTTTPITLQGLLVTINPCP